MNKNNTAPAPRPYDFFVKVILPLIAMVLTAATALLVPVVTHHLDGSTPASAPVMVCEVVVNA